MSQAKTLRKSPRLSGKQVSAAKAEILGEFRYEYILSLAAFRIGKRVKWLCCVAHPGFQ